MTETIRAQRKALEIIASFARNQAAEELLRLPAENAAEGSIEMVSIPKEMFDSILAAAMDTIAQQSGGKRDTQKELAAALMNPAAPIPDQLVGSLMGYAGHWSDLETAQQLCWAFRRRNLSRFEDPEMREYFEVQDFLKHERFMSSVKDRIGGARTN